MPGIVVEEADETEFWLDLLSTNPHHPAELVAQLRREAIELRAIFSR